MILLNMTDFRFIIWFSIVLVFFVTIACLVFPKNIPLSEEQKYLFAHGISIVLLKRKHFSLQELPFDGSFLIQVFYHFYLLIQK